MPSNNLVGKLNNIISLIYCDFKVMMTFSAIVRFNSETLILQYPGWFFNYFSATWTVNHIYRFVLRFKKNMNIMNSEYVNNLLINNRSLQSSRIKFGMRIIHDISERRTKRVSE